MTNRLPILDPIDTSREPIGFIEFEDDSLLKNSNWVLVPGYVTKEGEEINVVCVGLTRTPKC